MFEAQICALMEVESEYEFEMIWAQFSGSHKLFLRYGKCLDHWFCLNVSLTQNPIGFAIVAKIGI